MGLSDEPDDPNKYVFPPGTTIPPNDFLVVTAGLAADNEVPSTEFGISGSGDGVYLFAADGQLLDQVTFGYQATDFSIGRYNDEWAVSTPTLGTANIRAPTANPTSTRINEWLASATYRFGEDYLELINPESYPVSLEGMRLTDDVALNPTSSHSRRSAFWRRKGFSRWIKANSAFR